MEETAVLLGWVGFAAALIVSASDVILLGRHDEFARYYGKPSPMIGFPFWRINVGNWLGVIFIPLVILGFAPLWLAFEQASRFEQIISVGGFSYFFAMGGAGHAATAFSGVPFRAAARQAVNDRDTGTEAVIAEQSKLFAALAKALSLVLLTASVVFSTSVLSGRTALPFWVGLINPFVLMFAARYSHKWLPRQVGGYLSPVNVYVGFVPLIALTTILRQ